MSLINISEQRAFNGCIGVYEHQSEALNCTMRFSVFTPMAAASGRVPVLTFLSGLTCTHDNFTTKAGAYKMADELGLMIVAPDTSPRGDGVADDDSYDMGQGAGFYLNAVEEPWAKHFQMESYITEELQQLIGANFAADMSRQGLTGHSMGGHGALTLGLKNPNMFKSLSAFAPISSPMRCPWGIKALTGYLGSDQTQWFHHDTTTLLGGAGDRSTYPDILVHQGLADNFLEEQLKPELLKEACEKAGQALSLEMVEGFDHSYYFIASFIDEHLKHHHRILSSVI